MNVGDRVLVFGIHYGKSGRFVPIVSIRGDYVYVAVPGHRRPRALHRRTGRGKRDKSVWLAEKHLDPQAGRGTTK